MCGIAGVMSRDGSPVATDILERLRVGLAHRGPDGHRIHKQGAVGLVHTRLAIIDLHSGDQPLFDNKGTAIIVNGEIYNYLELKAEMKDVRFSTASDCEPPLHLYRKFGLSFVEHLRGMYALALFDPTEGTLILSRDPFGIKPLYYAETSQGLAFASEPQALIKAGLISCQIDPKARMELLQLQFTTGRETIYQGIHRVLPGETLVAVSGRIIERRRRDALPLGAPQTWDETSALEILDEKLMDSIKIHQRSDVPYGLFLSGGVDSSALLAGMNRDHPKPLICYTIGFPGANVHDERDHAAMLSAQVGARHVAINFGEEDFWRLLPQVAAASDDPCADYAMVPTMRLAEEAKKELKVVLSGEGGDELFGGYGRYRTAIRPLWRGGRMMRQRGVFDGTKIIRQPMAGWRDGLVSAESLAKLEGRSKLQVVQAVDCADWLPHDLLIKTDRCLMWHQLEGRTPFLDPEVGAFAFLLPDDLKIRKGRGKYLLRRWLEQQLPAAQPFDPKRGFTVPVGAWINHQAKRLAPLLSKQPGIVEIANISKIESLLKSREKHQSFAAWVLLFYATWHQIHVIGRAPEGDLFSLLAN